MEQVAVTLEKANVRKPLARPSPSPLKRRWCTIRPQANSSNASGQESVAIFSDKAEQGI
jgi:hypothetical protein